MTRGKLEFLDTNVLVYAFTLDSKASRAEELLAKACSTSVQALSEFTNVARRKLGYEWNEVRDALATIRTLCDTIVPIDLGVHDEALRVAERYQISTFDATMLAAALLLGCRVFWSEDMQDGMVIEDTLRIRNPFGPA